MIKFILGARALHSTNHNTNTCHLHHTFWFYKTLLHTFAYSFPEHLLHEALRSEVGIYRVIKPSPYPFGCHFLCIALLDLSSWVCCCPPTPANRPTGPQASSYIAQDPESLLSVFDLNSMAEMKKGLIDITHHCIPGAWHIEQNEYLISASGNTWANRGPSRTKTKGTEQVRLLRVRVWHCHSPLSI